MARKKNDGGWGKGETVRGGGEGSRISRRWGRRSRGPEGTRRVRVQGARRRAKG